MPIHRALTTVCSLMLVTILGAIGFGRPGQQPAAAQSLDQFTEGQGIANSLLQGWLLVPSQGQIVGRYSATLEAPLCDDQQVVGCQASDRSDAHTIELTVERASSQATAPGDELPALLRQIGFVEAPVTIDGHSAIRFVDPGTAQYYSDIVVLELEGVYYHLAFSRSLGAESQLVNQILAGFDLRPAEAPAPFILPDNPDPLPMPNPEPSPGGWRIYLPSISTGAVSSSPASVQALTEPQLGPAVATPTSLTWVFNREEFVRLAGFYGGQSTNPGDGYYHPTADGAHFIDCMLRAVGLPGARCNGPNDSYMAMSGLLTFLQGTGAETVTTPARGDVLFLHDGTNYCWGGVVVDVVGQNVYAAGHSYNYPRYVVSSMRCNDSQGNATIVPRASYLRIDADAPSVTFLAPGAGRRHPGDVTFAYQGTDLGSGLAGYTLRLWKDGSQRLLASRTLNTTVSASLDFPCRALTAEVVAHDRTGNVDEARGDSRALSILLRGDVDADGVISAADLDLLAAAEGLEAGQPGFTVALDPTGDGRVDAADRQLVQRRIGESCPLP